MADTFASVLRESLPLLLGMAVLEVAAGSFLGRLEQDLELLPGFLAMVPAVLAMRGNISASLGSRLGTAARFGLISRDRWWSPLVGHNLLASLILGVFVSIAAAVVAHWTTVALGLPSVGVVVLAALAVLAGLLSGVAMMGVAIVTMRMALARGVDLDNVGGPILMTTSDLLTLAALWLVVQLAGVGA